jgi:hypothetical protein
MYPRGENELDMMRADIGLPAEATKICRPLLLLLSFSTRMPYFHVELTCLSPLIYPVQEYEAGTL